MRKLGLRTLLWSKQQDPLVRLANDDTLRTMVDARRISPEWDVTRSWDIPDVQPFGDEENFEDYLKRIGFSDDQLDYAQRGFGNAAGEALRNLSAKGALAEIFGAAGEGDFRILDGYDNIIQHLAEGLDIRQNTIVTLVEWGAEGVRVHTADGKVFDGERVIVTIPVGVLQSGSVQFSPELPADKREAISTLKMGPAAKLIFRFAQPILPPTVSAIYSAGLPAMWWRPGFGRDDTQMDVWTGWVTGDYWRNLLADGEEAAVKRALQSLRAELDQPDLTPVDTCVVNWTADPFARGGYTATNPGGIAARETIAQPTPDENGIPRLLWAGEATAPLAWVATVHGAHISGQRVAKEVLSTEF